MRVQIRPFLSSIALLAVAGTIGLVAIADHWYKQRQIERAEFADWQCQHHATNCGGPDWQTMESHWEDRQVAYEIVVGLLGVGAVVSFAWRYNTRNARIS